MYIYTLLQEVYKPFSLQTFVFVYCVNSKID